MTEQNLEREFEEWMKLEWDDLERIHGKRRDYAEKCYIAGYHSRDKEVKELKNALNICTREYLGGAGEIYLETLFKKYRIEFSLDDKGGKG